MQGQDVYIVPTETQKGVSDPLKLEFQIVCEPLCKHW